jgi:hypothetical protein
LSKKSPHTYAKNIIEQLQRPVKKSYLKPHKLLRRRYNQHEKWAEIMDEGQKWCSENPEGTKQELRAYILDKYGVTEDIVKLRKKKISWAVEWAVEEINKIETNEPEVEKIKVAAESWVEANDYASKQMIKDWSLNKGAKMFVRKEEQAIKKENEAAEKAEQAVHPTSVPIEELEEEQNSTLARNE